MSKKPGLPAVEGCWLERGHADPATQQWYIRQTRYQLRLCTAELPSESQGLYSTVLPPPESSGTTVDLGSRYVPNQNHRSKTTTTTNFTW